MMNIKKIPGGPGVYLFKDKSGKIIYIGKSRDLKKRVSSYFTKTSNPKTQELAKRISDAEFIVVESELEALLLENRLIKTHKPFYNISLKDSSTYPYIKITPERFPRIVSTRIIKEGGIYFGPFVDSLLKNEFLEIVNKSFGIRTCRKMPKHECLNYHIGLCCAPCIKNVSEDEYSNRIKQAKEFLGGNHQNIKQSIHDQMKFASKEMQYEIALEKRIQLDAIDRANQRQRIENIKDFDQDVIAFANDGEKFVFEIFYVRKGLITNRKEFFVTTNFGESESIVFESFISTYYQRNDIPNEIIVSRKFWSDDKSHYIMEAYISHLKGMPTSIVFPESGEKKDLVLLAESNAKLRICNQILIEMKKNLRLPSLPRVIECFDISNLGYDHIVGAMVRFFDGEKDKTGYRKFEIRGFSGRNDDFSAIREIVYRRYKRLSDEKGDLPDLVMIDGGIGQLNAARESLERLKIKIPLISIAKKDEEIFVPENNEPVKFDKNSKMMLFIRHVRDEAHRFAISYNRKKRSMGFLEETKKIRK